jgi:pantothenate synthetase
MSGRPTVVVTRRLPEAVERELARDFDARLNRDDRPLGAEGLREALGTADALLTTVTDKVTADVLAAEPRATPAYVSVADGRTLAELERVVDGIPALLSLAVRFGPTRLIDNEPLG